MRGKILLERCRLQNRVRYNIFDRKRKRSAREEKEGKIMMCPGIIISMGEGGRGRRREPEDDVAWRWEGVTRVRRERSGRDCWSL